MRSCSAPGKYGLGVALVPGPRRASGSRGGENNRRSACEAVVKDEMSGLLTFRWTTLADTSRRAEVANLMRVSPFRRRCSEISAVRHYWSRTTRASLQKSSRSTPPPAPPRPAAPLGQLDGVQELGRRNGGVACVGIVRRGAARRGPPARMRRLRRPALVPPPTWTRRLSRGTTYCCRSAPRMPSGVRLLERGLWASRRRVRCSHRYDRPRGHRGQRPRRYHVPRHLPPELRRGHGAHSDGDPSRGSFFSAGAAELHRHGPLCHGWQRAGNPDRDLLGSASAAPAASKHWPDQRRRRLRGRAPSMQRTNVTAPAALQRQQ